MRAPSPFRRSLVLVLWCTVALGCELRHLPSENPCPSARQLSETTCCPPWSSAADDACTPLSWSSPRSFGADAEFSHDPVTAVDGLGRVHLAWSDGERVLHAVDDAGTVELQSGPPLLGSPRELHIAASPDGESILMFRQGGFTGESDDDAAIFMIRRDASGEPTSDPVPLSLGVDAYQPRVVIGSGSHTFLTWNQWTGENYGIAHVSLNSPLDPVEEIFATEASVLSPLVFFSNAPRPAIAADGSLIVTWYQSIGQSLLTFVSERDGADGPISRPDVDTYLSLPETPVSNQPFFNPTAAIADDGRAAVMWMQSDLDGHIAAYLATRDAAGSWTTPASLTDSLGPRTGKACCGHVALSPTGELGAAWEQDGVIHVALRDASGTLITPKGTGLAISTLTAQALDVHFVFGEEGSGLVTYRERATKTDPFRVIAHRLHGASVGPAEVLSSTDTTRDVFEPLAAIGGQESLTNPRAVISWREGGGAGDGGTIHYVTLGDP